MILPETGRNKAPPASATAGAAACGCAAGAGAGALLGVAGRGAGAVLLAGAAALCCAGSVSLVMGAGKAWLAEGGGGGVEAPGTAPSAILPVAVSSPVHVEFTPLILTLFVVGVGDKLPDAVIPLPVAEY